eukprot:4439511-Amphidinium_carterae.1
MLNCMFSTSSIECPYPYRFSRRYINHVSAKIRHKSLCIASIKYPKCDSEDNVDAATHLRQAQPTPARMPGGIRVPAGSTKAAL